MGQMPLPVSAQQLVLAALSRQLHGRAGPVYADIARLGASLGVLGNRHMRRVAAAAVEALGETPTAGAVWRFGWQWWYQRSVDELIAYQADRLTPEWAERHVLAPLRPPPSSILLSVHQFNLPVAAARAVQLVDDLGVVSVIDPLPPGGADVGTEDFLLPPKVRARALGRFYGRIFEGRIFSPTLAARRGLELLRRGGSLIVYPDFFGQAYGSILGRSVPVAHGALWLAHRSGRPIVPFLLIPPNRPTDQWRLWCGEPIHASSAAVVATLERCIRRLPTTWPYWRGWYAAPEASRAALGAAAHSAARRVSSL
jgi:hypothetical protein